MRIIRDLGIINIIFLVSILFLYGCEASTELKIYQPVVTHTIINQVYTEWSPAMHYNHDADIAFFRGRYFCVWNANPEGKDEGYPGQYNYLSYSDDFRNWSVPVKAFASEGGAINPVDDDYQWQPNFINFHDEVLYCAWCVSNKNPAVYISYSNDGIHWTNTKPEQQLPEQIHRIEKEQFYREDSDSKSGHSLNRTPEVAFPTNHGLLTKDERMLFPVSFPPLTWESAALISEDKGKSWVWGNLTNLIKPSTFVPDPAIKFQSPFVKFWEPVFYEYENGDIGMIVRCVMNKQVDGFDDSKSIFHAISKDGGYTFSSPVSVEVPTLSAREMIFRPEATGEALFMVANDWLKEVPMQLRDRNNLSLYLAPVSDPDLLLPGPLVQQKGNTGHYPNGEIRDGKLCIAYSYGMKPRAIYGSRVEELPDFSEPFLLPRGGSPAVEFRRDGKAWFPETYSTLGLVLTEELTKQEILNLEFNIKITSVPNFYPVHKPHPTVQGTTVLTVGGINRNGTVLRVINPLPPYDVQVRYKDKWHNIGQINLYDDLKVNFEIRENTFKISINDNKAVEFQERLLRKISFGGLYLEPVVYPTNGTFELDLNTIKIY